MNIVPIAYYHTKIQGKFGLPRQSGLTPSLLGEVKLVPEFNRAEALRGLEEFDYLWLIWSFDLNPKSETFEATVRPPRLGGNKRMGVFASRSPFRPNGLGLSSLRIESVDAAKGIIVVSGADLADGTAIYDIKPYVEYADSHRDIRSGFVDKVAWKPLKVSFAQDLNSKFTEEELAALSEILAQDPRPQYQKDPKRIYKLRFGSLDLSFTVNENDELYCFCED